MADNNIHQHLLPPPSSSMKRPPTTEATNVICGEIVEVKGGHIVRSTASKDRHSKVCTAKGPRDRRVRLSAHTAIQFYDVQDRLGFDRPSKAVDWLIKKAKTSIDDLAELPPWKPAEAIRHAAANAKPKRISKTQLSPSKPQQPPQNIQFGGGSDHRSKRETDSSFLLPSMESDTKESFFPVIGSLTEASPNQLMHPYHHHHPPDLLSRTNSQNQDLRLSLQSFPNGSPSLLHNHHQTASSVAESVIFHAQSNPLGFDTSTVNWEQQSSEFGRIQKLVAWNNGGETNTENRGGGFLSSFQPILSQSQVFSQRGPLQSSYTPMIRAWFDPHHHQSEVLNHHHHIPPQVPNSAIPGTGFASDEFSSGFRIPARLQGQEEEHDGLTNKPSSTSRHL